MGGGVVVVEGTYLPLTPGKASKELISFSRVGGWWWVGAWWWWES